MQSAIQSAIHAITRALLDGTQMYCALLSPAVAVVRFFTGSKQAGRNADGVRWSAAARRVLTCLTGSIAQSTQRQVVTEHAEAGDHS